MRINLLLIALFVSVVTAYGQKCKYDFEKKDLFTGKSQKGIATVLAGFGARAFRVTFQAEDKKYLLGLIIAMPGRNESILEPGDTLSFVLENGELLTFLAKERYLPNVQVFDGNIFSYYMPFYDIREQELKKFEVYAIKATKLKLGTQPLVVEAVKNVEKIKKAAGCIQR